MLTVMELSGKVVIVTGASSGIGEATARLLHRLGAVPVLAARRLERLDALARELDGARPLAVDMRQPEQVRAMVETTVERFGRVPICAGKVEGPS